MAIKLTESRLRQIIREELEQELEEGFWDSVKDAGKAIKDAGKTAMSKVTGKEKEYIKMIEDIIRYFASTPSKFFPTVEPTFFIVVNRSKDACYPAGKITLSLPQIASAGSVKLPQTIELDLPIKIPSTTNYEISFPSNSIATDSGGMNIPKDKKEEAAKGVLDSLHQKLPNRVARRLANAILSSIRRWFEKETGQSMPQEIGQKFNKFLLSDEFEKSLQGVWERKLEKVYAPMAKELVTPDTKELNQNGLDGLFAVNLAGKIKAIKS